MQSALHSRLQSAENMIEGKCGLTETSVSEAMKTPACAASRAALTLLSERPRLPLLRCGKVHDRGA